MRDTAHHRAFYEFESVDVPLDLTLTPRMFECCPNRRFIIPEIACKLTDFTHHACMSVCAPAVKCCTKTLSKHLGKPLAQLKQMLELSMKRTHLVYRRDILRGTVCCPKKEEIRSISRRQWLYACQLRQPRKTKPFVSPKLCDDLRDKHP